MIHLLLAFALQAPACHAIHTDRIYGRDLAAAIPLFAALPPDLAVGFAPVPGMQRIFHPPELRRIAQENHLDGDISEDVCFAWSLAVPNRQSVLAAMQKSLDGMNAQIEILDQCQAAAPEGEISFPLTGLSAFSDGPVVWRGYVTYGGNRRFSTWARVRVTVKGSRLVATEALRQGEPISIGQVRVETYEGPLQRDKVLTSVEQAMGMMTTRPIAAGAEIRESEVAIPSEVSRGDTVEVDVQVSSAHITAEGIAEESGRRGAVITVRNAKTGRKFRARIDGKDKVSVLPGGGAGLVGDDEEKS
ncbi:MAG TPA: flagellar basal body P-ring formation chaperone FlgA [Bryobacteraceae bacterium]|jgi:flagella basal body P-ring formation protein FlgA|nr:flagellar basal body P-ring formation chaperone FlgA [Bryobacteraceae bacterium]